MDGSRSLSNGGWKIINNKFYIKIYNSYIFARKQRIKLYNISLKKKKEEVV